MANYECVTRSNYFHVKDPAAFRKFMDRVYGLNLWEEKDAAGQLVFGFGAYGGICGISPPDGKADDEQYDDSYDTFVNELQEHIAEDDAVIILEAGYEKMRYVVGSAIIVTHAEIDYLDISSWAVKRGAEMLNSPDWTTKCDY